MTIKEMYADSVSEAYKAARQVTDPQKRAMAFAAVAQALAASGAMEEVAVTAPAKAEGLAEAPKAEPEKEEKPAEAKPKKKSSDAFKRKPRKTESAPKEEKAEVEPADTDISPEDSEYYEKTMNTKVEKKKPEKAEEKKAEESKDPENFTEEWSAPALEYFSKELAEMQGIKTKLEEAYGDENIMNDMIKFVTQDQVLDEHGVTPLNIRYILSALKSSIEEAAKEDDAATA